MNSDKKKKVLLIDDNDIDNFINKKVLEFNGFASQIMNKSAQEALVYLREASNEYIPDIIFLDLNMPIIDGFKFLLEFSKMPDLVREKSSIIVLTSSNNIRDREKIAANADVIAFVPKPLTNDKLDELAKKI